MNHDVTFLEHIVNRTYHCSYQYGDTYQDWCQEDTYDNSNNAYYKRCCELLFSTYSIIRCNLISERIFYKTTFAYEAF